MEIKPFRAYRFDQAVVGDVGDCIAPPYDVIDDDLRERLYNKNKYNIIRLTKGKTAPSDNQSNNRYTRAAEYLSAWIKTGVLKADATETIYAYVQEFELTGRKSRRLGFIALAKLEEFGKGVRPHEYTLEEPKIDRLNLRKATRAQFGLVFMLYKDRQNIADKIIENAARQKPLIDFLDEQNVRHQIFAVTGKDEIAAMTKMISTKPCIIADGHHRYETGLRYYKETGDPAAQYQLTAFVNSCQPGLFVLATHRLIENIRGFDADKLINDLKHSFDVTRFAFDSNSTKQQAKKKMLTEMKVRFDADRNAFGIYTGSSAFYVATLKDKRLMNAAAPDTSDAWKALDVAVLHKLILEKHLGIDDQRLADGGNIEYVKDTGQAIDLSIEKIDRKEKQAAFFVNPTKLEQIEEVTAAGERMPQKSTYFFPKVFTGLTVQKF